MNKVISYQKIILDEENEMSDEFKKGAEDLHLLLNKIKAAIPTKLFMELDSGLAAYESIVSEYYYEGGFKEGINLMKSCSK